MIAATLHNFRTVRRPDCPVCPCGTYDRCPSRNNLHAGHALSAQVTRVAQAAASTGYSETGPRSVSGRRGGCRASGGRVGLGSGITPQRPNPHDHERVAPARRLPAPTFHADAPFSAGICPYLCHRRREKLGRGLGPVRGRTRAGMRQDSGRYAAGLGPACGRTRAGMRQGFGSGTPCPGNTDPMITDGRG